MSQAMGHRPWQSWMVLVALGHRAPDSPHAETWACREGLILPSALRQRCLCHPGILVLSAAPSLSMKHRHR